MSVRFRFDPFSTAFSNWSVFDENAQHIVWAENLYTSKCMDFQMKTHFGPLHHGPKAHFYQIFHSKTAKTKSMHNWGKKKGSYKWKYYEVLAKNSTLSISGLFWTTLNSVNFVLFKIWKGFLNKCNFFNTPNKKDSNLQLCYVRIQAQLPNLPVFQTVPGRSGAAVFTSVCCWGIYYA